MDEARKLARRISKNPPDAVRMAKILLRESRNATLRNALELAAGYQALAHHSNAHETYLSSLRNSKG
jgi:enoyl-CoA hydratase/carnithine racemase